MNRAVGPCRIGYFGKIPAHDDFVKAADDQQVVGMLDDWLARVMTRLPGEPRWKLHYDAMAPVSFAFVGPGRRHAVAGHLVASHDRSGRRYPFLTMRKLDVPDPGSFIARCPLVFAPLWKFLESAAPQVLAAPDPSAWLQAILDAPALGEPEAAIDAALTEFLAMSTVGSLSGQLGLQVDRMILGLGLLLQPVMHSRPAALHKSLVLPLPAEDTARFAAAAFWLALVTPFVRRTGYDLVLFVTTVGGRPALVVGFGGAAAATLHALIDPLAAADQQVHLEDNGWIDEQMGIDIDVRALASYLEQPMLPLRMARDLFLKTFIGVAS
jgi:type VI secretion system protein ImpM